MLPVALAPTLTWNCREPVAPLAKLPSAHVMVPAAPLAGPVQLDGKAMLLFHVVCGGVGNTNCAPMAEPEPPLL